MRRILVKVVMQQTLIHFKLIFSLQGTTEVAGTYAMQSTEARCFENNGSGQRIKENTQNICASIIAKLQGSGVLFQQLLMI